MNATDDRPAYHEIDRLRRAAIARSVNDPAGFSDAAADLITLALLAAEPEVYGSKVIARHAVVALRRVAGDPHAG